MSEKIEHSPLRETKASPFPVILAGAAILFLFFSGVILWTVFVPLHAAIHAPGEVVFKGQRQAVQHLEGGIVKQILVKNGDTVQEGQPLIVLENRQVEPLVNMLEEQLVAETASIARLEAEIKGLAEINFPPSIAGRVDEPAIAKIVQVENKLFTARRDVYNHQVKLLRLQMAQIKETIKGSQERFARKNEEIASLKEQFEANSSLLKEGYVTKTVVLELQRILAEKTGEREGITSSMANDQQRLTEFEQRILALSAEQEQRAINELKQSTLRRLDLKERIRPNRDTLERQVIRAPVSGKVVGLSVTTIGGVILPRDQLMEIAPSEDNLILEAKISLNDIAEVALGQKAEVSISSFNRRSTPPLKARVTYVSDDRIISTSQQGPPSYYAAYLEFDPETLDSLKNHHLIAGMSGDVTIAIRPRTTFDYLIEPMQGRIRKALHVK